jgi:prokaryotic ubiquitin-like protein Pup
MSEQSFQRPQSPSRASRAETTPAAGVKRDDAALESLLDEIDSVLETNAEDYVRSFVQKGGQ